MLLVGFSFGFFRVAGATFGFAERTDWCVPMDLLVAGQTSLERDNKLNKSLLIYTFCIRLEM